MICYFLSIQDMLLPVILVFMAMTLVGRWFVFRKMGVHPLWSLIPIAHEYKIYKKCWKTWPFIALSALIVILLGLVNLDQYGGLHFMPWYVRSLMMDGVLIIFILITVLMYKRLTLAFGRGGLYLLGLLFINPIFMLHLGLSKDEYHPELAKLDGKKLNEYMKNNQPFISRLVNGLVLIVVLVASGLYVSYTLFNNTMPKFIIQAVIEDFFDKTDGKVNGEVEVVYPSQDTNVEMEVRDMFFPDTSDAKEAIVYVYLIGADLEDTRGYASINLEQMKEATKVSDKLTFIVEAGGSWRYVIDEIKDRTLGRYMIRNGEITLIEALPKASMSEPKTLEDFLVWANEQYPSERKMLYFWDHGGGLRGYGKDMYVEREDFPALKVSEIASALKNSGYKYEMINFDSCLMQTMEVGTALEPYADYLLASEETEPGYGQYYTLPFSKLAEDPGMSIEEFSAYVLQAYDEYLAVLNDGSPQTYATLSLVELRKVPTIQKEVSAWIKGKSDTFLYDRNSFINLSQAHSRAYQFAEKDQLDLIDFLAYNGDDERTAELIEMVKSSVVVRSGYSAEHINGLAFYMPYNDMKAFNKCYGYLKELGLDNEIDAYDEFASIIASQKTTASGHFELKEYENTEDFEDYTEKEWYVKGFEDYDASLYLQDVKLIPTDRGYKVDLSEEEKKLVTEVELGMRIRSGNKYADLGSDDVLADEDIFELFYDGTWLTIEGVPVYISTINYQVTEEGEEFICAVPAVLDLIVPIDIYVKRTVKDGKVIRAEVLGYVEKTEKSSLELPTKGYHDFLVGELVSFSYDWYLEDGNYYGNSLGHLPVRVGYGGLQAEQSDMSSEEYEYYGIIWDTMNRTMETVHYTHEKE